MLGKAAAHGAKKPHAREVLFDTLSLLPMRLWVRKFKDAYFVLLCGKLIENLFDKNEVENLINFVKVRLFKVFMKLPSYKLCI